jgi:YHS domain-containing protein
MKTRTLILVFSLIFIFSLGSVNAQEKQAKEKKAKTTKVEKTKTVKSDEKLMCAVMPEMAAKKNINYTYKGKKYYFCCKDCLAKFKKEPEKYAKK